MIPPFGMNGHNDQSGKPKAALPVIFRLYSDS
jgi:hypothetical protein